MMLRMHARSHMPATLKCGDPEQLRDEDTPKLPQWYPLPPRDDDGREIALSSEQRDALRRARARTEALEGPFDNQRRDINLHGSERPPEQLVLAEGRCVYVLSERESNQHHAVYRYSPQLSLMHHAAMRAVEDGFAEYGQQYALEARHDDEHAIGYSER